MVDIAIGTYRRVSVENEEEMMEALNVNYFFRMAAAASNPEMTITKENEAWTFKTSTIYSDFEMTFEIGKAFDETTPDGREVTCIASVEGNKFIIIQNAKHEDEKSTKLIREFTDEGCTMTIELLADEDVVCIQRFERIL